jgi:Galactose oxidase, central domain
MRLEFWEWMIASGQDEHQVLDALRTEVGPVDEDAEGFFESRHNAWHARNVFDAQMSRHSPIWSYQRMGASCTQLPDGRIVCIGGEHEDHYDPDFFIYNDVVVFGPSAGQLEIYGYPKSAFPPTDFHTACLVGDRIIVVGCLGYPADRRPGTTPVFALDVRRWEFTAIETGGHPPGWLSNHEAHVDTDGVITLRGGDLVENDEGSQRFRRNVEEWALDTRTWQWSRITSRFWQQFVVHQKDNKAFLGPQEISPADCLPSGLEHTPVESEEAAEIRFVFQGVPIVATCNLSHVDITIEGCLSPDLVATVTSEMRRSIEAAIDRPCVLEELFKSRSHSSS